MCALPLSDTRAANSSRPVYPSIVKSNAFWPQVTEVLVKWRQLGYELATWERLPALEKVDGAEAELARLHALQPIADEAEQLIQVRLVSGVRQQPVARCQCGHNIGLQAMLHVGTNGQAVMPHQQAGMQASHGLDVSARQ